MIKTENVSFRYPDGTVALNKVNLEVRDGEFLALIGANGSGKTTLLRQLIGLLKPSSGKVFLNSTEFRHFKDEEVFRRVGMVFQDPNDQLFAATVEQDVAFGAVNLGLKPEEVTRIQGIQIAPDGTSAENPAFDVTPSKYITTIITERGIIKQPFGSGIKGIL